ncbi:MAG: hypothetical protein K2O35_04090 [Clostridia bacterium]|nr:hypothetical protein [Clostridia bacterium]
MNTTNSAIMQMIRGERGTLESINYSDEYEKAKELSIQAQAEFIKKIEDNPTLRKQYFEMEKAIGVEYTLHLEEIYKEAFYFGLSIGLESKQ